ncbi:alpha/beta fold hydrolase [Micromonospora sp. NPDC051196]|uniref:thioesterase II family protein n=1 Tax=Micromonospora sp. NPDC051196 TaxID=3155281 RepID=UPI00342E2705
MATAPAERWFRRYRPAPDKAVQLLCLPHAGGSATFFHPLARALASELDVIGVQYPGRQDRWGETPLDDLRTLADRVFEALATQPVRPLVILGHSMGAVLGFEVARRVEAARPGTLLGLIASGRRSPTVHRDEDVHLRDNAGLLAEVRRLSGDELEVVADEDLLRMILPPLRADFCAVETYRLRPGDRLRAPITVLTGDRDPQVTLPEARAWAGLTDGGFAVRVFPGGHFYLQRQQEAVSAAVADSVAGFRRQVAVG